MVIGAGAWIHELVRTCIHVRKIKIYKYVQGLRTFLACCHPLMKIWLRHWFEKAVIADKILTPSTSNQVNVKSGMLTSL